MNNRSKWVMVLSVWLLLVLLWLPAASANAGGNEVEVSLQWEEGPQQWLYLHVQLSAYEEVAGAQFELWYDDSKWELQSGYALKSGFQPFVYEQSESEPKLVVAMLRDSDTLNPEQPSLITWTFKGIEAGNSVFELKDIRLSDNSYQYNHQNDTAAVDYTAAPGSVTVQVSPLQKTEALEPLLLQASKSENVETVEAWTDQDGQAVFADLSPGIWTIEAELEASNWLQANRLQMEVEVGSNSASGVLRIVQQQKSERWELKERFNLEDAVRLIELMNENQLDYNLDGTTNRGDAQFVLDQINPLYN